MRLMSLSLAALALAGSAVAAAPPAPKWTGVWRNAANTVHLRAAPCGPAMCGTVIWASDKAKADVADRTGGKLVGMQLFRDMRQDDDDLWYGQVYVPDIDARFAGTIAVDGPNQITGTGCLFGNLGCKTQVWTRIAGKK